jgi:photosystem II stability/assembly factor-like uncharacterized protein
VDLYALHIADPDDPIKTGFAAGDAGTVFVTQDSGATWQLAQNVGQTVYGIDVIGAGHN